MVQKLFRLLKTIKRKNNFERLRSNHHHCDRFISQTILTIILQICHKTNLVYISLIEMPMKTNCWNVCDEM